MQNISKVENDISEQRAYYAAEMILMGSDKQFHADSCLATVSEIYYNAGKAMEDTERKRYWSDVNQVIAELINKFLDEALPVLVLGDKWEDSKIFSNGSWIPTSIDDLCIIVLNMGYPPDIASLIYRYTQRSTKDLTNVRFVLY